jgi:hypothetical protein
MVQLRIEIGAELTTLIIRFGRMLSFVSICLVSWFVTMI